MKLKRYHFLYLFVGALFFAPNALSPQINAIFSAAIALLYFGIYLQLSICREFVIPFFLLLGYAFFNFVSLYINLLVVDTGALLSIARPVFYILSFSIGYDVANGSNWSLNLLKEKLCSLAYILLIVEGGIVLLQAFGHSEFLSLIFNQEKTRGFSTTTRATGTLGNPNMMAFLSLQCGLLLYIFNNSKQRVFLFLFSLLVVLLTGSRTILIIYIVAFLLIAFYNMDSFKKIFRITILASLGLGGAFWLLLTYSDSFRYMLELIKLVREGGLQSIIKVHSVSLRLNHWNETTEYFFDHAYWINYLFGLGPRNALNVLDNDFLYSFYRYGIIASFLLYGFYFYLYRWYSQCKNRDTSIFGKVLLLAILIFSLVSETVSSWYLPIFFLVLTGLLVGAYQNTVKYKHSINP